VIFGEFDQSMDDEIQSVFYRDSKALDSRFVIVGNEQNENGQSTSRWSRCG